MNMSRFIYFFLFLIFPYASLSQQNLFEEAKILIDDGKYSAAQSILNQISFNKNKKAEIMYLNAKCSKNLFLSDAVFLYNMLDKTFPYHAFKDEMNKDLALIYYRQKQYTDAIHSFLKVESLLNEDIFKLAYSYFSLDSLEEARLYFSRLIHLESKFSSTSQYYYSYIAYKRGLYKSALEGFKQLLNDEKFSAIVPYYICQIHFFQKEYDQLIVFAQPLIENVLPSRKSEIHRLLAEAYYRTGDFTNAIIHFEELIMQEKEKNSLIHFSLGHCYYKLGNYESAISNLEYVSGTSDSILQYSTYYLAASYLELKHYNYSLQAFKKSASYNYNKELQEDAYYNYAKLSYQLDMPFENTLKILNFYLENFSYSDHAETIKVLMAKTLQATSQYFEAYDVLQNIDSPSIDQQISLQQLAFFLGVKSYNQQDFQKAITYFNTANQYPVNDVFAYLSIFWLADCYFQISNYDQAIYFYNSLSFNSDSNITYYDKLKKYNLAYSYFQKKDYLSAVKWFRAYEKFANDSMRINDAYLRIADGYFMSSDFSLATKYYSKAIKMDLFDVDYALYQSSIAFGLIGWDDSKLSFLKRIYTEFAGSSYYDNALYDLAEYYKKSSNYDLAIKYYDDLIISSLDINLISGAYLSKAMIDFNSGRVDSAINEFLFVVNNYQQTKYFKEALSGLRSAYASIAKIEEYLEVVGSLPGFSITESEQDSLTYNTAFMKFSEMDYATAKNTFNKYLEMFENGIFVNDAIYYNAISALHTGDTIAAVMNYTKIVEGSYSDYKEPSLIFLARRNYSINKYKKSNLYYTMLLDFASSNSIKRESIIRLMIGNEYINKGLSLEYAKKVVEFDKIDNWLLSKAYIIIARNQFDSGNYAKSKLTFEQVAQLSDYDEGAEAQYYLAYLTYLDEDLEIAEELVFSLSDNYSNDYFIAKAFILLSDIYLAKGNVFQAKATLESVIENHDDEVLVDFARSKWEIIVESEEKKVIDNEVVEQSFIEISEYDFEYEIDEDYIVPLPDTINIKLDSLDRVDDKISEYEFE
ncbi:MAG: hypothetical protein CMD08_04570 [Flavobacteriales bacterium]|nr:hypothetical protein [Flavobacteriales bacterium]